jgi:hypothetical protein
MTDSPLVKRMLWSGILAGASALTGLVANRLAAMIWMRLFDEEPPE